MNRFYKVIWSEVRNCYMVVSEIAKSKSKSSKSSVGGLLKGCMAAAKRAALLAGALCMILPMPYVLADSGPPVMPTLDYKGATADVTIASTAATMNISSTKLNNVMKWIDFSIGNGGTVQFDAKNYLNYVTGHGRSEIDGILRGGGNIYLINPNGILFGSHAQVDVGSLILSTRSLDDAALNAFASSGTNPLASSPANSPPGDIINLGKLNANNITVEGNNITFKNVADVTKGGTTQHNDTAVKLTANSTGEIHIGSTNGGALPNYDMSGTENKYMYKLVSTKAELEAIGDDATSLSGNYMLANDIDLEYKPFRPIGYTKTIDSNTTKDIIFTGKFDGLGYKVSNLKMTLTETDNTLARYSVHHNVGLFGINSGTIENLGVENTIIDSTYTVGGVVGWNNGGIIQNVYHTGRVKGTNQVGGIAGANGGYSKAAVIKNAFNTGEVYATNCVGGITGNQYGGSSVINAYNTGAITANSGSVGGIVGQIANVGTNNVIENAYNTGAVTGTQYVGGIVGNLYINSSSIIKNTYNVGNVECSNSEASPAGGIVGSKGQNSTVSVTNSYYSQGVGDYGTQKTLSELKQKATFSNWDISDQGGADTVWRIYEGQTTPLLTAFLQRKDVTSSTEYNGSAKSIAGLVTSDSHISATDAGTYVQQTDAGTYNGLAGGKVLYSDQSGYDIVDAKLIIQPKKLTAAFDSNTYNGTNVFSEVSGDLTGVIAADADDVSVTATATYDNKNVGMEKSVTYSNIVLAGDRKDNYIIADTATGTGTITTKALTVNCGDISRTYDGGTTAAPGTISLNSGVIDGDDVTLATGVTGAFADKHVGTDKEVTYSGIALTGDDKDNYSIEATATGKGTITQANVTLTAADVTKTYDGTTTVTGGVLQVKEGFIFADDSFSGGTFAFADKNAGTNKTVTVSNATIADGNSGGNYNVTYADNTSSTITRKALELVADKVTVEEGQAKPAVFTGSAVGFVAGEGIGGGDKLVFALANPSASTAGTYGIVGEINGRTSGDYGLNYTFSNVDANANAFVITPRPLYKLQAMYMQAYKRAESVIAQNWFKLQMGSQLEGEAVGLKKSSDLISNEDERLKMPPLGGGMIDGDERKENIAESN